MGSRLLSSTSPFAKQLNLSKNLSRLSWAAGLIAILAILFWFWKQVISRIKNAAESCLRVAKGEFGTRIEDTSKDEIGAFSGAFNSLSARTRPLRLFGMRVTNI